jgi:hypothetical protein
MKQCYDVISRWAGFGPGKAQGHNLNVRDFDHLFELVNVNKTEYEASVEYNTPEMCLRYEFIELLCRITIHKYWITMEVADPNQGLDTFMEEFLPLTEDLVYEPHY